MQLGQKYPCQLRVCTVIMIFVFSYLLLSVVFIYCFIYTIMIFVRLDGFHFNKFICSQPKFPLPTCMIQLQIDPSQLKTMLHYNNLDLRWNKLNAPSIGFRQRILIQISTEQARRHILCGDILWRVNRSLKLSTCVIQVSKVSKYFFCP